jgi:bleomycin hydrolase
MLKERNILETRDEAIDSRLISYLNQAPVNDGGQWDMAVNLIRTFHPYP